MTDVAVLPVEATQRSRTDDAGLGTLATEKGNLPMQVLDVDARITGLVARTELRQTFVNPFDETLEATYIFPLPDRAAVTGFRMEVGDRTVRGELKERGQARDDYELALAQGKRATIAEEERPGVFTVRVGNLAAGERATVVLDMVGPLPYSDGEATYRFPLVVAPRYIPGAPLPDAPVGDGVSLDTDAVPDASRITPPVLLPDFPNPLRLGIRVEVDPGGLALGPARASLHTVQGEDRDGRRTYRLEPGDRANRDFILRFPVATDRVVTALTADRADEDGEGTVALTVVPPAMAPTGRPRDVVVVLDRSGSMSGWKMVAARRAAARLVDSLGDRDRFAVLAFDNVVERPDGLPDQGLAAATDRHRYRAVEFLASLEARGGTELGHALQAAVGLLAGEGGDQRERALVLVTDGQVGNEDQVLHALAPRLAGIRALSVGIDTAVNRAFLERIAGLTGGLAEYVESEDRLDEVLARIHRRVATPVLQDLRVEPAGLDIDPATIAPARIPDVFPDAPVTVLGRFRGAATGELRLTGRTASGEPWSATLPVTGADASALTALWARAHLRDLEDAYAAGPGADEALERRIIDTSLRFGVLCRFTAFVAVDERVVNEGGSLRRIVQPVDAPAGWASLDHEQAAPAHLMRATTALAAAGLEAAAPPAPSTPSRRPVKEQLRAIVRRLETATPSLSALREVLADLDAILSDPHADKATRRAVDDATRRLRRFLAQPNADGLEAQWDELLRALRPVACGSPPEDRRFWGRAR